jgi:drug/metabolite transporter (DMT)-like permease
MRKRAWTALIVVYLVWGSTYLAIRVGVRDLPPLTMAGVRYLTAGAILYPIAVRHTSATGADGVTDETTTDRPTLRQWLACAVIALLLLVGGNGALTISEKTVPSGLAAVLVATVPLWMILFSALIRRHRVTRVAMAGLTLGLAGVAVLAGGPLGGHTAGVLIVLAGSASWGLGSVLGHRLPLPRQALLGAAMQMIVGGVVLILTAAATGELSGFHPGAVHTTSWIALIYLIVPGSILAFTAYGYALAHLPPATVSTYAYVNPVVAVVLGAGLLGEAFTLREVLGTVLVVGSVALTLRTPTPDRRSDHAPAPGRTPPATPAPADHAPRPTRTGTRQPPPPPPAHHGTPRRSTPS